MRSIISAMAMTMVVMAKDSVMIGMIYSSDSRQRIANIDGTQREAAFGSKIQSIS
jgi:hypothetical protein